MTAAPVVRLGVISDVHWPASPAEQASWHNPFDFAGLPERLDRALELFGDERVDGVVVAGDVSHAGDRASARGVLDRVSADARGPVFVVSGNHDHLSCDRLLQDVVEPPAVLLDGARHELDGWRLAGVGITHDRAAGGFRWDRRGTAERGPVDVLISHFPVVSRAQRVAELGLVYSGDLLDLPALASACARGGPTVVLSGHIHVRESHAAGNLLQLSAGALVEAPFEAAIVDLERRAGTMRVRRRSVRLGPAAGARDPVLAPDEEAWVFRDGAWRDLAAQTSVGSRARSR